MRCQTPRRRSGRHRAVRWSSLERTSATVAALQMPATAQRDRLDEGSHRSVSVAMGEAAFGSTRPEAAGRDRLVSGRLPKARQPDRSPAAQAHVGQKVPVAGDGCRVRGCQPAFQPKMLTEDP